MRVWLASSSPRRIELLRAVGLRPRVLKPDVPEVRGRDERPAAYVRRLARAKAEAIAARLGPRAGAGVVVAADTIVVDELGRVLEKPRDAADARRMLGRICGREHVVYTGTCLIRLPGGERRVRVATTRVRLRALSRAAIARYVATGEPMDKAGAYAAQGLGMALVAGVRGSHANVVGLPVEAVLRDLEAWGVPLFGGGAAAR